MSVIRSVDDPSQEDDLAVRAPRQRRTREQWDRILEAGVRLLEDSGYQGFTIAALCECAQVPPRALYARAATKDALFLAVYEHGMDRVRVSQQVLTDPDHGPDRDYAGRIETAVRDVVAVFTDHAAFLRAVVLVSSTHPEVRRRGAAYRAGLGELFGSALAQHGDAAPDGDHSTRHEFCFSMVFAALVVRTAYGPDFGPAGDPQELDRELVRMAQRYLLAPS